MAIFFNEQVIDVPDSFDEGVELQLLLIESYQANMKLFEETIQRDFREEQMIHEGLDVDDIRVFSEGTISNIIDKLLSILKSIGNKIREIWNKFINKLKNIFNKQEQEAKDQIAAGKVEQDKLEKEHNERLAEIDRIHAEKMKKIDEESKKRDEDEAKYLADRKERLDKEKIDENDRKERDKKDKEDRKRKIEERDKAFEEDRIKRRKAAEEEHTLRRQQLEQKMKKQQEEQNQYLDNTKVEIYGNPGYPYISRKAVIHKGNDFVQNMPTGTLLLDDANIKVDGLYDKTKEYLDNFNQDIYIKNCIVVGTRSDSVDHLDVNDTNYYDKIKEKLKGTLASVSLRTALIDVGAYGSLMTEVANQNKETFDKFMTPHLASNLSNAKKYYSSNENNIRNIIKILDLEVAATNALMSKIGELQNFQVQFFLEQNAKILAIPRKPS